MKTFAKHTCLFLLVAWAGSAVCVAQSSPPAPSPASTNNLPKRFSGKIASVDPKTKMVTLQGTPKIEILVTDKTKIIKAKAPAAFDVLATGQLVNGRYRLDSAGKWAADNLNVGDQRQPLTEPITKTFVVPEKPKAQN